MLRPQSCPQAVPGLECPFLDALGRTSWHSRVCEIAEQVIAAHQSTLRKYLLSLALLGKGSLRCENVSDGRLDIDLGQVGVEAGVFALQRHRERLVRGLRLGLPKQAKGVQDCLILYETLD